MSWVNQRKDFREKHFLKQTEHEETTTRRIQETHQSYDSHCTLKVETTVTSYTDACNYQTVVHITTFS